MESISEIFGLHRVTADILKLIGTPTWTLNEILGGTISGANPHAGGSITLTRNCTGIELIGMRLVLLMKSST